MGSISARDKGDCERKKRTAERRRNCVFFAETGLDLRAIARVIPVDEEKWKSLYEALRPDELSREKPAV